MSNLEVDPDEAAEYRTFKWELTEFKPQPALIDRSNKSYSSWQRYYGQDYDRNVCEVRDGGWDHEHCDFCWAKIWTTPAKNEFSSGYTDGADAWVCPPCYEHIILRGESIPPSWRDQSTDG